MATTRRPDDVIKAWLAERGSAQSGELARQVGISRQALHRHLLALVDAGEIVASGAGRGASYRLAAHRRTFALRGLAEDVVWRDFAEPALDALAPRRTDAANAALRYAFTELLNNAIEHARGARVEIVVGCSRGNVAFEIADDGVGAFARIRAGLRLRDDTSAILELTKGKVTTAPAHHTGEGIFFSSKVADRFEIESNELRWVVDNTEDDTAIGAAKRTKGTRVRFELSSTSRRTLAKVFDAYTVDQTFSKTRTWVKLFSMGKTFMSRSEARRLMHRLDRFEDVVLDFAGVEIVGQGFADEVFRVWTNAHRETRVRAVRAIAPVAFMINRARAERGGPRARRGAGTFASARGGASGSGAPKNRRGRS